MEQKFSNNSLDLETLREFCKREGEAVTYRLSFTFAPRNQSWFKCEGCLK